MSLSQNATERKFLLADHSTESFEAAIGIFEDCAAFQTTNLSGTFPLFAQDVVNETAMEAGGWIWR